MKKFTQLSLLVAASTVGFSAMGDDATWQYMPTSGLPSVQRTTGVAADFNNDGLMDLYMGGEGNTNPDWQNKGIWDWQTQSSLCLNLGNDTFDIHNFTVVEDGTRQVQKTDANGNNLYLDADGNETTEVTDNPVYIEAPAYKLVLPDHGIMPSAFQEMRAFDYNNDGLVDLLVIGAVSSNDQFGFKDVVPTREWNGGYYYTALYKNLGNNKFQLIEDTNLPSVVPDNGTYMYPSMIASGDYDRDGYTDLFITGIRGDQAPEGYSGRLAALYHNDGGTGKFTRMDIAEVQGGVWTDDITEGEGDDQVIVTPKQELEGWFLQTSENAHFVDLDNDGWLDIVTDGWGDHVWDGVHDNTGGAKLRVYHNENGTKFVDVTPVSPNVTIPRSTGSAFADFDGDGYLDFFKKGYDDAIGWSMKIYNNEFGTSNDINKIFDEYLDQAILLQADGSDGSGAGYGEGRPYIRDFNGDGILDIYNPNNSDKFMWYGDLNGNFILESDWQPFRGVNANDCIFMPADFTNNGLLDIVKFGYGWDGFVNNSWGFALPYWKNTTEAEIEAPETPADVTASYSDGELTIEWTDSEGDQLAYNLYVRYPDGSLFTLIPADPATGFVKVEEGKEIAVRPGVQTYTIKTDQNGDYTVGVQALSLANSKASAFATATVNAAGINNAQASDTKLSVAVNGDQITVSSAVSEPVNVYNTVGQRVAQGMTNQPIRVTASGILMVKCGNGASKLVK